MNDSNGSTSGCLSEATFQKLADSISQQANTVVATLNIPEFTGSPKEDVTQFIEDFELSTLTLNDELKHIALQRALKGPARTWAKANLNCQNQERKWEEAIQALTKRFAAPDVTIKNQRKLAEMKFDQEEGTLTSYVEAYVDCYKKTFKAPQDSDIIRSLSTNLPSSIILQLNMVSDTWMTLNNLTELYELTQRLDTKILPYKESKDPTKDSLTVASVTKLMSDLKELSESIKKSRQETMDQAKEAALAAIKTSDPTRNRRSPDPKPGAPSNRSRENRYNPYQRDFRRDRTNNQRDSPAVKDGDNQLFMAYVDSYGKPPGPCQLCKGEHWNRHCPYKDLNA